MSGAISRVKRSTAGLSRDRTPMRSCTSHPPGPAGPAEPPPRPGLLRDPERPAGPGVADRVPHVGELGDLPPAPQPVPAAALGAALDRVPRHGAGGEQIPGVGPPVER